MSPGAAVTPEMARFQALSDPAKVQKLAQDLRATRHLLILDNLESVTGALLAIRNTLPEGERNAVRDFLKELRGGRTVVLLGTRGGEDWLTHPQGPLRTGDIYDMQGLDPESASTLAERILKRVVADPRRQEAIRKDEDYARLQKLLAGYPLP